ncbi:Patched domain-containing protein 3 [Seminavis robusta]|uniref:Patched domain-containing protein 3 n=1 Tax=Seminavis robusta TaxID=568900 RepID=A0A9N8EEX5_9STRA|nr:Patched domain-containing protein 3 [Seminavis robusta]|eukprot:Sro977_g227050.1 Patched domain-containing protein 3 (1435) ;mRNA; r:19221-24353
MMKVTHNLQQRGESLRQPPPPPQHHSKDQTSEKVQALFKQRKQRGKDDEASDPKEGPLKTPSHDPSNSCKETSSSDSINLKPEPVCKSWTHLTEGIVHRGIRKFNVGLGTYAAQYPRLCILLITLFSFGIVSVGFFTNFVLVFSHDDIFTPMHSRPKLHSDWIRTKSNFPDTNDFVFIIHANGEDVMNVDAIRRLFFALDTYRNGTGYKEICAQSHYLDVIDNEPDCWIWSATNFWHHNVTEFEEAINTDEEVVRALSQKRFQDGAPVFQEALFGKFKSVNQTFVYNAIANEIFYYHHKQEYLTYVPNYVVNIGMPEIDDSYYYQERLLDVFNEIRNEWKQQTPEENPHGVQLEFFCGYAYELEYARALYKDFYLVPVIFFVMLGFTCFIFHQYGSQQVNAPTRATIGLASVVTIGMSMMSGFGLMFCLGVPFTNITLMAPFIILGVGLDDTFIITGAYFRRLSEEIQLDLDAKEQSSGGSATKKQLQNSGDSDDDSDDSVMNLEITTAGGNVSPLEQLWDHSVVVNRIRSTLEEVGMSIALTTITTTTAFMLGIISSIPGIRWLCLYASVTIVFDSLYQVTYFVALLTLDERRVVLAQAKAMVRQEHQEQQEQAPSIQQGSRRSCSAIVVPMYNTVKGWFGRRVPPNDDDDSDDSHCKHEDKSASNNGKSKRVFIERFMAWYARTLLKPPVRNSVIIFCTVLMLVCVYSTTQLRQKFDPQDYVPDDSFTQGFFDKLYEYAALVLTFEVYFRGVDQSDPKIQQQMRDYVFELSAMPQINQDPDFCWFVDMQPFLTGDITDVDLSKLPEDQKAQADLLIHTLHHGNKTFEEKLGLVLDIPVLRDLYAEDIVFNDNGEIVASRCYMYLREFDLDDVQGQVNLLFAQRAISESQPINQLPENQAEWAFFTFDTFYTYWELYAVAVDELIFTTISGVVAVCGIGFIIIPHWTATLFVGPLIIMLYFDLLGVMQFCGIDINAVTYVTIVISIGLLVDFLMHILLRYYETKGRTRDEKVRETLETMGASMMLGGFTTWLGVIPMALSTTSIFMTIFVAFLGMVSLGLLIGLALLPALLSIWGPIVSVEVHNLGKSITKVNAIHSLLPGSRSTSSAGSSPPVKALLAAKNPYRLVELDDATNDKPSVPAILPHSPSWGDDDTPSSKGADKLQSTRKLLLQPNSASEDSIFARSNDSDPSEHHHPTEEEPHHVPRPPGTDSDDHSSERADGLVLSESNHLAPCPPRDLSDQSSNSVQRIVDPVDSAVMPSSSVMPSSCSSIQESASWGSVDSSSSLIKVDTTANHHGNEGTAMASCCSIQEAPSWGSEASTSSLLRENRTMENATSSEEVDDTVTVGSDDEKPSDSDDHEIQIKSAIAVASGCRNQETHCPFGEDHGAFLIERNPTMETANFSDNTVTVGSEDDQNSHTHSSNREELGDMRD